MMTAETPRHPLYAGGEYGGVHRDVFIEPLDEEGEDAYFNEHHFDHHREMPEGPLQMQYAVDHEGHVQVYGSEDHHRDLHEDYREFGDHRE